MSHWAEIKDVDGKKVVQRVIVGNNDDPAGDEGYSWIVNTLGGTWLKTSYNAATNGFRKKFAVPGYIYDESSDAFYPPKPFESWVLDANFEWVPPVEHPQDERFYTWNEETISWVLEEEALQ